MKSGFVQLIVKVSKNERRRVIQNKYLKRYNPLDSFKQFTLKILPKMEQKIQYEILKETLRTLKSNLLRNELINAYIRRLMRLKSYEKQEIASYIKLKPLTATENIQITDPTIIKDLNQHSFYDVGSYCQFIPEDMQKFFLHECFGTYKETQFLATKKFGVMIREEGIKIVQGLRRIQNAKEVNWNQVLSNKTQEEIKQYVNDQDNYINLFIDLSNCIYQKVKPLRDQEHFKRMWGSSVISDTIVNSILKNLHNIKNPRETARQAVQEILDQKIPPSPMDFNKRFKVLKSTKPQLPLANTIPYNASFFWKTPSFKNVFLGGEGGTGRSMILTYISMWASKNNWIVINCTSAYKMCNEKDVAYRRCYTGLFLSLEHGKKWLQQFRQANLDILKKTKVNMDLYGKMDISGIHQRQYNPVPDTYDPRRQINFNSTSQFAVENDPEEQAKDHKRRMSIVLPNPDTLNDIAIIGIKNKQLSICAIAEILQQIYELDHPTLVCADGFNWFYRPSSFNSPRYFNDRGLYGKVPPYHIALARLFLNLDGHRLKRGLKVVASSNSPLHNHKFDIKKIFLPQQYEHKVRTLTPQEFENAGKFNMLTKWWQADQINQMNKFGYMYTISQGNWGDFQKSIGLISI